MNIQERTRYAYACTDFWRRVGFDPYPHAVVWAQIGSMSQNLNLDESDVDRLGLIIPPVEHILGLGKWEHWESKVTAAGEEMDVKISSLRKYVGLLLKSNPDVMGILWLRDEDYFFKASAFEKILAERNIFSSKEAYKPFVGYAADQLRNMAAQEAGTRKFGEKRKALVEKFGHDVKQACHAIRLLRMCREFLLTGQMQVYRTTDAEELKAIKRGEKSHEYVQTVAAQELEAARQALEESPLPDHPNRERAEKLIMEILLDTINAEPVNEAQWQDRRRQVAVRRFSP